VADNKNNEERFKEALFLCLFLCTHLSVDKVLDPLFGAVYREIKPCYPSAIRPLDNAL
jgi:hypothetical protein